MEEEFLNHIQEILRRIRSGEERVYSIEEVSIMLGLEELGIADAAEADVAIEQQRIDRAVRIKGIEELIAEGQRLNLGE